MKTQEGNGLTGPVATSRTQCDGKDWYTCTPTIQKTAQTLFIDPHCLSAGYKQEGEAKQ